MRDCLITPEPHLSLIRLRREGALSGFAGLLLHDQEWLAKNATGEIVLHSDRGWNCIAQERARSPLLMEEHVDKTRVVVEGNKIKLGVEFTIIDQFIWHTDVVGGDEMFRAQFPQHCQLPFKE